MTSGLRVGVIAVVVATAAVPARARTIVITDAACDRMAMIAAVAPRMSWACNPIEAKGFTSEGILLRPEAAFLIRFPLDAIPKGQRIVKAELLIPPGTFHKPGPRIHLHRVLADWGPGVCWLYRTTKPNRVPWAVDGCAGSSTDRAPRPTAILRPEKPGEIAVNVTEDVERWNSGGTPNNGWRLTCEDDTLVGLPSPVWQAPNSWKLRITYEPR